MRTWNVKNLRTNESRTVRAYNNIDACEICGWRFSYCECSEAWVN